MKENQEEFSRTLLTSYYVLVNEKVAKVFHRKPSSSLSPFSLSRETNTAAALAVSGIVLRFEILNSLFLFLECWQAANNSSRPHLHMRRLTAQRISRSSISWHLRLSIHIVAFTTLFPLEPLRFLRVENRAVVVRSLNSMFRCVVFHSRWNDVFNFSLPFTLLAQLYTA